MPLTCTPKMGKMVNLMLCILYHSLKDRAVILDSCHHSHHSGYQKGHWTQRTAQTGPDLSITMAKEPVGHRGLPAQNVAAAATPAPLQHTLPSALRRPYQLDRTPQLLPSAENQGQRPPTAHKGPQDGAGAGERRPPSLHGLKPFRKDHKENSKHPTLIWEN